MSSVKRTVSRAFASSVRAFVRIAGRSPRLILTYHRVGEGPGRVRPAILEEQIRWARGAGFEFIPVARLVDWVRAGNDLPPKAIALTFDDGLADTARLAAPVLRRNGVTAMVFPVLAFLGGPRRYASERARAYLLEDDRDPRTVAYDYMTWDELDAWVEAGFEIGGHTLSHPFLGAVDEQTGRAEIEGCRRELAARYGAPPRIFCYPFGDDSGAAGAWVKAAGFEAALTSHTGVLRRGNDLFHLPRLSSLETAGAPFADLLSGVFLWRQRLGRT